MARKKRKRGQYRPKHGPRPLCGYCGKPIAYGERSNNLYERDAAYRDRIPTEMAYVHKSHVPEEDHPLYDQMPHIVLTGLPPYLEELW